MKKILLLSLVSIFTFSTFTIAESYFPSQIDVLRGNTIEIMIPKYDISKIEGTFQDEPAIFYEIQSEPKFDEPISRAEFLELIFKNSTPLEVDENNSQDFPDVLPDNPFYESIQLASSAGIINGYQNGYFGPYDTLTRGQIAKITTNFFNPTISDDMENQSFQDVPDDHIFFDHIDSAVKAGYFQGYPDGLMRPDRAINFSEAETIISRAANLNKGELQTLGERTYFKAFVGINRRTNSNLDNLLLTVYRDSNSESEKISEKSIPINIIWRDYPTHSFNLAPSKTELFGDKEQDNTWDMIYGSMDSPEENQLWEGNFIIPTTGETTLGFGDQLYINGSYSGSHFGIDYANSIGTEINSSNHGIVKLSDFTPSYGGTIVIDHGQNVFTMYLHLSELKVQEGQEVKKGELIGLMGDTGIATGSHLHFTHFIGKVIVDNHQWLNGEF